MFRKFNNLKLISVFFICLFFSNVLRASENNAPGANRSTGANRSNSDHPLVLFFTKFSSPQNLAIDKKNADLIIKIMGGKIVQNIQTIVGQNDKESATSLLRIFNQMYRYKIQETPELFNHLSFIRDEIFSKNALRNRERRHSFWVSPMYNSVKKDFDVEVESLKFGYESTSGGDVLGALGWDINLDNLFLGIAFGSISKVLEYKGDYVGQKDALKTYAITLYSGYYDFEEDNKGFFFDGLVSWGWNRLTRYFDKNIAESSYKSDIEKEALSQLIMIRGFIPDEKIGYKNFFRSSVNLSTRVGYSFPMITRNLFLQPNLGLSWRNIGPAEYDEYDEAEKSFLGSFKAQDKPFAKVESSYNLELKPTIALMFRKNFSKSHSIIKCDLEYAVKPINKVGEYFFSIIDDVSLVSHNFGYLSNKWGNIKIAPAVSFVTDRFNVTLRGNYKKEINYKLSSWGISANIGVFL